MSEQQITRAEKGRFAKGALSPNPGGRPRETAEVRELARQHTDKAVNTLVSIMEDQAAPPAARVAAASAILDRGYGKAPQSLEVGASEPLRLYVSLPITQQPSAPDYPELPSGEE